jgi:alkylation response protein AidB-like acyl-CoA dehydrogenase
MADSRNYANINFNNVEIPDSNILGDLETGGETVENILILEELLWHLKC